jgi:hypothetical protein
MLKAVVGLSFVSVTVLAAEVEPTATVPKVKLLGAAASGANPDPVKLIRPGEPRPL